MSSDDEEFFDAHSISSLNEDGNIWAEARAAVPTGSSSSPLGPSPSSAETRSLLHHERDVYAMPMKRPYSKVRLWGRIMVVVFGSALSSSILQAFPTIEPILLDRRRKF